MKLPRRTFLHLAAGAAALSAVSRIARAQTYPSRPVRIIVGFAPGGGNDIMARLIGPWLSERFGQQFVIENRPGAGTNIATEAVVNASPDGYTLLLASLPNASNATLYEHLKFNFISDITPVAGIIIRRYSASEYATAVIREPHIALDGGDHVDHRSGGCLSPCSIQYWRHRVGVAARGPLLARDVALALPVCVEARMAARGPDCKPQAVRDQGRRIPLLGRQRDHAIRGAPSDRHERLALALLLYTTA